MELLLPVDENARRGLASEGPLRSELGDRKRTDPSPSLFWFRVPELAYRELNLVIGTNRFFISVTGPDWLAVRQDESPARHWFVCRNESELGSTLKGLAKTATPIPEYFGLGVEVAGKSLGPFSADLRLWHHGYYYSKGAGGVKKEIGDKLATQVLASAVKSEAGNELLKVNVYLTSPSALFERQQTRVFWFGLLILTSTIAALIGLLTAWRAFSQQLQLSEMKSNFVSSVSHELRAPIASVRLMAESLERGKIPEPPKQKRVFPLHRPGMPPALVAHRERARLLAHRAGPQAIRVRADGPARAGEADGEADGAVCGGEGREPGSGNIKSL